MTFMSWRLYKYILYSLRRGLIVHFERIFLPDRKHMNLYFFVGLVLLEASGMIMAVRIPLDYNSPTPFLHHSGADGNSFNRDFLSTFSWSSNFLGKLLHQASKVEIGPRGVRFIRQHGSEAGQSFEWIERSMGCTPSDLALCQVRTK